MAIFTSTFEVGDLSEWTGSGKSAGCTIEASMDQAHHGSWCLKAVIDDPWDEARVYKTFASSYDTIYIRFNLYLGALPAAGKTAIFYLLRDSNGNNIIRGSMTNDGGTLKLYIYNIVAGEGYSSGAITFNVNTFHCIRYRVTRSNAAGIVQGWVDSSLEIDESGKDTDQGFEYKQVRVGNIWTDYASTFYFDCVEVDSSSVSCEAAAVAPVGSIIPIIRGVLL